MENGTTNRPKNRLRILLTLFMIASTLFTLSSVAASANNYTQQGGDKVLICHATGSATNPYNLIEISINGLNGHEGHEGDIIPAPAFVLTEDDCLLVLLTLTPGTGVAATPGAPGNGNERVTICHATGSATNPYNEITVSVNGLNGHDGHEGDIIPAPANGCPAAVVTGTPGPVGTGTATPDSGGRKIMICHATSSATNPYNLIEISINGLNGHDGHEGDIIPAPASGCPNIVVTGVPGGGKIMICHATGSATNPYNLIEISINGLNGHDGHEGDIIPAPEGGCPAVVVTATPTLVPGTPVPGQPIPCAEVVDVNGVPVIGTADCQPDTTVITPPVWPAVTLGAGVCPDWLVYHTNQTGDWELFRLDSVPSSFELNLSRGVGPRVFDVAPSRSPDAQWIVFTSNRDGNWEIYLSAVESDLIQRVTYNTTAIDLDPVWSPTGSQIVYESNRTGNWDLYMFDVASGVETQLTDSEGNDVNASWSYDGTKLVFQSDRTGVWQIFEYTFEGAQIWQLSNETGDDHDPQYTVDNTGIVFRSFRDSNNSILYRMNIDGSNITALSDPNGYAMDAAVSPLGSYVAYTSNLDGDKDIYIFEFASGLTRKVTDTLENDYAPTWYCGEQTVAFTSDVTTNPDLFSASALPIDAPPVVVMGGAIQLTTNQTSDQYPMLSPAEENASRNETFPSPLKNR